MKNNFKNLNVKTPIDFKSIIKVYLKQWKWFVLSVFFAIGLAFVYIRYSTPEYSSTAKLQILDDNDSASELSVFQDGKICI